MTRQEMIEKESKEHPEFSKEQIEKIVDDHLKLGVNAFNNRKQRSLNWHASKSK